MLKTALSNIRTENLDAKTLAKSCEVKVEVVKVEMNDVKTLAKSTEAKVDEIKVEMNDIKTLAKSTETKVEDVKVEMNDVKTLAKSTETKVEEVKVEMNDVKTLAKSTETKVEVVKVEINEAKELVKSTDTKLETIIEAKLVDGFEQRVNSKVDGRIKGIQDDVVESLEIEKRRGTLIFHGVKESKQDDSASHPDVKNPDTLMIEEILRVRFKLDPSRHIEEVSRIGKYVDCKTRPIRIKVRSMDSKTELLRRAKELKDITEFKCIFISPDLTQKQQKVDKDLRDHLKKFRGEGQDNVRIKSGKVVKKRTGGAGNSFLPAPAVKRQAACNITPEVSGKNKNIVYVNKLNCFFVNARSLMNNLKIDELNNYAIDCNLHVIGIAETWLNDSIGSSEVQLKGYTLYRKDRADIKSGRGGGVMLYVQDSLISRSCLEPCNYKSELVWCAIKLDQNLELCVGVCYRSPSADNTEVQQLFSAINSVKNKQLLIMGDFNYPNIDWDLLESDQCGSSFLDLIQHCFLVQHVQTATRDNNILDLVLTSEEGMVEGLEVKEHFLPAIIILLIGNLTVELI